MGLENIVRLLREEAEKEGRDLVDQARIRASEVLRSARNEAEEHATAKLRKAEASGRLEARLAGAAARKALALKQAELRHRAVERVFSAAREALSEARRRPAYRQRLEALLDEAIEREPGQRYEVFSHPADLKTIGQAVARRGVDATLNPDPSMTGGVRVLCAPFGSAGARGAEGLMILDNSFEARLERAEVVLRGSVARLLFEDGER